MSKYIVEKEHNGNLMIEVCFCIGIIAKQFYLLPNGSLQIGDIFMLIPAGLFALRGTFQIEPIDRNIGLFVLLATAVNTGYYFYYKDAAFLKYTTFLVFSFIIIWTSRQLLEDVAFISKLRISCYLAVMLQSAIAVLNMGRSVFGSRYIGTFNDPNQLAFYVFSISMCGYACGILLGKRTSILLQVPAIYLIYRSSSMSMTFGFLVFLAFAYLHPSWSQIKHGYLYLVFTIAVIIGVYVVSETELLANIQIPFLSDLTQSSLWKRTIGKIDRADGDYISSFIRDRSMGRILEQPIYILFGAGEGHWIRYSTGNEIHCTMIALLYYYGIIPYLFFWAWIISNLKGIKKQLIPVFIAIILEAFTLANHRQPTFWLIFVIGSHVLAKTYSAQSEEEIDKITESLNTRMGYIKQSGNEADVSHTALQKWM